MMPMNLQTVSRVPSCHRYRREVCRPLVGRGGAVRMLAYEQVRAGLAWCFRRRAKELPPERRQQYADTEAQAQAE